MINKKTVFVLGAGASCPYGYPSGAHLRKLICLDDGFMKDYKEYLKSDRSEYKIGNVEHFRTTFNKSSIKSIDVFMANNATLVPVGKYIIAFEIFKGEERSSFHEKAMESKLWYSRECDDPKRDRDFLLRKDFFQGGDWYLYLYNRIIEGKIGSDALPDFSNGNLAFITFNYERSLEQFFYESLRNSFTEVSEDRIVQSLKQLKILHVYGQIAALKWQNPNDYVDYKPQIDESLLQRAANNIRTIYEEKENPELIEAQKLLKQSDETFFLGFGYAPENMEVLGMPGIIPPKCLVYGTAFNLIKEEAERIESAINHGRRQVYNIRPTKIESNVDCLMLLRRYLR